MLMPTGGSFMKIRFWAAILGLPAVLFLWAWPSPGPDRSAAGPAHAAGSTSVIRVGGDYDYPPYEFLDESGRPTGYNVELTRAIAKVMGLNVEIRLGPWGEIREALENREIQAVHGMFFSEDRTRRVDFSSPHTIIFHSAFARRQTRPIDSLDGLRGRSLVVMRGDILHDFVVEQGLSDQVRVVDTQAEALRELAEGRHDYALAAKLPGMYWIRELELDGIRPVGPAFLPSRYCYAVAKGSRPELLSAFNEGLAILNQTGQYAEIYEKWLGPLGDRGEFLPRRFLWWSLSVIGLLLLLLLGGYLWSRGIRRQVARRTALLTREIEERKSAEQALQRWGQVFEHARWGVAVGAADGERFEMLNPHYARLHGYEVEELLALPIAAIRPRGGSGELREQIQTAHARGHYVYQTRHRRKDGTLFPVKVDVTAVRDATGDVAYRVIHLQDITKRLAAEAALKESESRFRMLAESIDDVFWLAAGNRGEEILYVSPAFQRVWGRSSDEVILEPGVLLDAMLPEDRDQTVQNFRALFQRGERYQAEYRIVRPGGEVRWIWDRGFPAGTTGDGRPCFAGLAQDITERKRAETELRLLNRRLQTVRECDQALVTARSEAEMLRAVCRTLVETGGYRMAWVGFARDDEDRGVFPAASWGVDEAMLASVRVAWSQTREGAGSVGRAIRTGATAAEADLSKASDFEFWRELADSAAFRSAISLPLFWDGRVIGALSIYGGSVNDFEPGERELLEELANDLAFGIAARREREERRMAEFRLRESEARLKAIFSSVQVGITLIDAETHRVVDANPAALRMMRRPLEDVKGQVCHQFLCPAEEGACPITDLDQEIDESERAVLTADGESVPILKSVVRVRLEGREHLLESFIDISERKAAEAEREKLIGELRKALSEIRTLRGFLPICASCKKIRDDEGYWHQIEIYIRNRADVDFTHSICPDCQERLYGELFDDDEDDPAPE
jgi:PAS domain S-box-containing protein